MINNWIIKINYSMDIFFFFKKKNSASIRNFNFTTKIFTRTIVTFWLIVISLQLSSFDQNYVIETQSGNEDYSIVEY